MLKKDRREVIKRLFPEHLYFNEDYRVLIDTYAEELGLVADYIELFANLPQIDRTPTQFIKDICELISISYSEQYDDEAYREVVKRIFSQYEQRGTEDSMTKATDYSKANSWVYGDLFLDKTEVPERQAELQWPYKSLFRHSISKHSGFDKYADATRWRDGVVIIKTDEMNDRVREAVLKVIPAGLRFYFDRSLQISGDDDSKGEYGEVTFGESVIDEDYIIYYDIRLRDMDSNEVFSGEKPIVFSGRPILYNYYVIDKLYLASMLDEDTPIYTREKLMAYYPVEKTIEALLSEPFKNIMRESKDQGEMLVRVIRRGKFSFDILTGVNSGAFSGMRPLTGSYTGELVAIVPSSIIMPYDKHYPVVEVFDKKVGDSYDDRQYDVEIIITTKGG